MHLPVAFPSPAPGAAGAAREAARASTVGASMICESATWTSKRSFSRLMSTTARREWPPMSKKLSRTPIGLRCNTSCQIAATASSVGVRGA